MPWRRYQCASPVSAWVACVIAFLFSLNASATTVVPIAFGDMVDRADLIFIGQVRNVQSEWRTVGAQRAIFTMVTFAAEEILKGKSSESVTLQFLGGTVGDTTLEVADMPAFSVDDRVLLFVEANGTQFSPVSGVFQGKFGIKKDKTTGQEVVVRHDGKPLRDLSEIGSAGGAPGSSKAQLSISESGEAMALSIFKAHVRTQLGKAPHRN